MTTAQERNLTYHEWLLEQIDELEKEMDALPDEGFAVNGYTELADRRDVLIEAERKYRECQTI